MVLTGIRQMEMRAIPDPALREATDVLLKIAVVGVCGSDVHYYATGRIGSQIVAYPFAVGHECSAVVVKTGPAVKRVKPGDRVAVEPAMSCGTCDQCRLGRPHTCRRLRFLGCPGQAEGCLSEYLVMPEQCCLPLPAALTLEQAALIEPLAIGLYAARTAALPAGAAIAILGCGPIGLSALLAADLMRPRAIYATDKIDGRLAAARRAGAVWTGNPDRDDVVRAIGSREPLLLDAVFECCGQQEALDQAVDLLKPGGKLLLVGIPTAERISFAIDKLRRKELGLLNIRRQNHCAEPALELLAQGVLKADFMITHRFPLERAREAFDLVETYRDGVVKALIAL
jgi:L-iditol 2-dehydrogenase